MDPQLTRRGPVSHFDAITLTILACSFTAYVFGLLPALDTLYDSAVRNTQSKHAVVAGSIAEALPYVLAVFVAMVAIFAGLRLRSAVTALRVALFLRHRRSKALDQFVIEAREGGVSKKVATEAYVLVTPHYGKLMRAHLDDSLSGDLRLSHHAILDAAGSLLARCDRVRRPGEPPPKTPTVLEWMLYVEHSRVAFATLATQGLVAATTSERDWQLSFVAPARLARTPDTSSKSHVRS